eukprot:TRINITY_DN3862_c0_g3_i9.p1 TRINITY_DN3862_c0_g3~~TRINITY_DN3862_c0_g3_i9.p1  ORF type:complete len:139 (+),score=31.90 TRINITY_DN3862_c0_g3_i9:476-892(+)
MHTNTNLKIATKTSKPSFNKPKPIHTKGSEETECKRIVGKRQIEGKRAVRKAVERKCFEKQKTLAKNAEKCTSKEKKVAGYNDLTLEQERLLDVFIDANDCLESKMEILRADVKLLETINFFEPIEETEEARESPLEE